MKVSPIKLTDAEGRSLRLTLGRTYEVLGIEAGSYRILSDADAMPRGNEPGLYASTCFRVVEPNEPDFWECAYGEAGERYCYPPEWNEPGFFEAYHRGVAEVRERFWNTLQGYYPETWIERKGTSDIGFKRTPDGGC